MPSTPPRMHPPAVAPVQPAGRPLVPGAASSDDQLMARLQADEVDALGELYDRYKDRAYRLSLSVCHDRGLAEDAVQESFVSIWRSRATYLPNWGTVASWLLTVVRHRAIDVGRRADRHAARCVADVRLQEHASDVDVAAQAADIVDTRRLRELLSQLPDLQQEVITLAFYGQLTHFEIAERLDLPPGTVKGRMRLGLEKLRKSVVDEARP